MLVLIAAFGHRAFFFLIADLSESCVSHNVLSLIIQHVHTTWSGGTQNTVHEFGVLFEGRAKIKSSYIALCVLCSVKTIEVYLLLFSYWNRRQDNVQYFRGPCLLTSLFQDLGMGPPCFRTPWLPGASRSCSSFSVGIFNICRRGYLETHSCVRVCVRERYAPLNRNKHQDCWSLVIIPMTLLIIVN